MRIFLFICTILTWKLAALSADNQIRFSRLTVQQGLSRGWVKCIHQDRSGYLWVGTAEGLNKYNGIYFKTYKYSTENPRSINHNNINIIYESKKGDLWIGTQAGLNKYNPVRDEFIQVNSIKNYISCIYEFNTGDFLVGTAGGLFLFNPDDYSSKQLYTDIYVEEILKDRNNNFWMTTYNGLLLLDTSDYSYTAINVNSTPDDPSNLGIVQTIFQDSKGGLWLGTATNGLISMTYDRNQPEKPTFKYFKPNPYDKESISEGAIYTISEDENSILWVGVENGGVNLLDLSKINNKTVRFQHIEHNPGDPTSISNNSIHIIYRDRQNTMWVGTYGNGISYYNAILQKFDHYKAQPGSNTSINNNNINVIFEEEDYLWIGTEGGLNCFNKKKKEYEYFRYEPNNPHSLSSNAVWAVHRDSRGILWVGVWGGGLNRFNEVTKSFERFPYEEDNPSSIGGLNIYEIVEDNDSNLWIATMRGGLTQYDVNRNMFKRFREDFNNNSISCNWVNSVLITHDEQIWISTTEAVDLLHKPTGHFTTFLHDPSVKGSISYNGAICLYEDSHHNIWIGTSNGLNLYNKQDSTFTCYQQSHGLPDEIIKAIVEDDNGNLWLSTNNGISKFIQGVFVPDTPVFRNFNVSDGLQGNEFNSRAVFRNKEGMIYFGGTNGYNTFHPQYIKDNPYIPNIVFTNLLIYNKPVAIDDEDSPLHCDISVTKELKLTRKHSVFTIEFAALNMLAPENNRYAYYLEGFEEDWNYAGNRRSATYTNLDPGKYTFRVKASNNDGLWNEEGIALLITILPAWWQSNIAKIIYALIIIISVYVFRKHTIISVNLKNELWREHLEKKKTEELNQMKHQFFTNISHEIRTPLTLILGPLKNLVSENSDSAPLGVIYRNALRLKSLVDQIMDFSKIENRMMKLQLAKSDIVKLIEISLGNFIAYADQKNISLIFESTLLSCVISLDEDKMEKIIANILSNAIKNTPETGTVIISLNYNTLTAGINISITDTGKGIPTNEIEHIFDRFFTPSDRKTARDGSGIGLNLTKKLVEMQQGTIAVNSMPEKGSTFSIFFPAKEPIISYGEIHKNFTILRPPTLAQTENKSAEKTGKRILVIDDNSEMCDYISDILGNEYEVLKETNPEQSIDRIKNSLPDLIISDVMMPEIDGFELCKMVKNDLRFSHIPVILLTAKATVQDHITGYETGADDYIYKPFDDEILKARVKNLIIQKEKLRKYFIGSDGIINTEMAASSLDVSFMNQVMDQISSHYSNPEFNVHTIIHHIGMSRSIFYKKFKSLSDHSVNDLIRNIRLKNAADLLKKGGYSVSQVAYDCGFSDPAYFSKVFKEYYKISPKEFHSGKSTP